MSSSIEKLVAALVGPAVDLENAFQQLLLNRAVDTATGVQLDLLGKIVGQVRLDLIDDDYRRFIRARIATNRSNGRFSDLLSIAVLILNDSTATIVAKNEGAATLRLAIGTTNVTDALGLILFTFLNQAVAAGVRIVVEWSESIPSATFKFDSGPGFDVGHLASDIG